MVESNISNNLKTSKEPNQGHGTVKETFSVIKSYTEEVKNIYCIYCRERNKSINIYSLEKLLETLYVKLNWHVWPLTQTNNM